MRSTAATASSFVTSTTWSAPSRLPISSRRSRVPVRITGEAPSALATPTPIRPIGPGPITTTGSPAMMPPMTSRPYIAVPAVTTSVASSSDMSSGTWTMVLTLLTAYSAKPPSVLKPLARCPFSR